MRWHSHFTHSSLALVTQLAGVMRRGCIGWVNARCWSSSLTRSRLSIKGDLPPTAELPVLWVKVVHRSNALRTLYLDTDSISRSGVPSLDHHEVLCIFQHFQTVIIMNKVRRSGWRVCVCVWGGGGGGGRGRGEGGRGG